MDYKNSFLGSSMLPNVYRANGDRIPHAERYSMALNDPSRVSAKSRARSGRAKAMACRDAVAPPVTLARAPWE